MTPSRSDGIFALCESISSPIAPSKAIWPTPIGGTVSCSYSNRLTSEQQKELLGLLEIKSFQPAGNLWLTEFLDTSLVRAANQDLYFSPDVAKSVGGDGTPRDGKDSDPHARPRCTSLARRWAVLGGRRRQQACRCDDHRERLSKNRALPRVTFFPADAVSFSSILLFATIAALCVPPGPSWSEQPAAIVHWFEPGFSSRGKNFTPTPLDNPQSSLVLV